MAPDRRRFEGDKWGGKYLRSPDIYWTVLEKSARKLVLLDSVADIKYGIKTGADGWFHVKPLRVSGAYTAIESGDGSRHNIESSFLHPIVRSQKECERYQIRRESLEYRLVVIDVPHDDLGQYAAADYIRYGETTFYPSRTGGGIPAQRPSCASRGREWYRLDLPIPERVRGFMFKIRRDKHFVADNSACAFGDDALYEIHSPLPELVALLNCTLTALFVENMGRTPGGGSGPLAIMVAESRAIPVVSPQVSEGMQDEIVALFRQMWNRPVLPIAEELASADRQRLDELVFGLLGLTAGEQDAVYEAVIKLVEARLQKAASTNR